MAIAELLRDTGAPRPRQHLSPGAWVETYVTGEENDV